MTTRISTDGIADDAITAAKIANDAVGSDQIAAGSVTAAKIATGAVPLVLGVRQTVQGGPTSSGLPDFWPAATYSPSVTSLNLSTSGVSASVPFVVSASQGFGSGCERIGQSTANLTWTALTSSQTNYLYVDVGSDGTLTTGHTTTAPVYSYTASSGTNTFNMATMTMYTSGTTKGWRVFVGEAVTGVAAVTSVVMYAYNGLFISTPAVITLSVITSYNCNVGAPFDVMAKLICKTAECGYRVGDEVDGLLWYAGAYYGGNTFARNNTTDGYWKKCGIAMAGGLTVVYDAATNNTPRGLTTANWYTQLKCKRRF